MPLASLSASPSPSPGSIQKQGRNATKGQETHATTTTQTIPIAAGGRRTRSSEALRFYAQPLQARRRSLQAQRHMQQQLPHHDCIQQLPASTNCVRPDVRQQTLADHTGPSAHNCKQSPCNCVVRQAATIPLPARLIPYPAPHRPATITSARDSHSIARFKLRG